MKKALLLFLITSLFKVGDVGAQPPPPPAPGPLPPGTDVPIDTDILILFSIAAAFAVYKLNRRK